MYIYNEKPLHILEIYGLKEHYKKMGFRPRLKNAAIDPKNAPIG